MPKIFMTTWVVLFHSIVLLLNVLYIFFLHFLFFFNKKYFLTLESRNYINKRIPQLVRNDGTTIYDQFEKLNETEWYYKNLYHKRKHYLDSNDIIEQLSVYNFPDEKEP